MTLSMTNQPATTARRAPPACASDPVHIAFFANTREVTRLRCRTPFNQPIGQADGTSVSNFCESIFIPDAGSPAGPAPSHMAIAQFASYSRGNRQVTDAAS